MRPFWFDETEAQKKVDFLEQFCFHWQGAHAGEPLKLLDWERQVIRDVFGWKRPDGTRQYRTAFIEVPRKNGKSTLAAAFALAMLIADDEYGASVVSCAASEQQARCVWQTASNMVALSPVLSQIITRYRSQLVYKRAMSTYEVVSAVSDTKHGRNDSSVIFDEVHVQSSFDMWNVMTSSGGSRRQPLIIAITTAGGTYENVAYSLHQYAEAIQRGEIEDPSFYAYIRNAPPEMEWYRLETWLHANPSLIINGDFSCNSSDPAEYLSQLRAAVMRGEVRNSDESTVNLQFLIDEAMHATQSDAMRARFEQLYLNRWAQREERMLSLNDWCACGGEVHHEGRRWYGGLDMAAKIDINAFVLVSPPETTDDVFLVKPFFWIPESALEDKDKRMANMYKGWAQSKFLRVLEGQLIDVQRLADEIKSICELHGVEQIAFDAWNAYAVAQILEDEGLECVQFPQTCKAFAMPTKTVVDLVARRRVQHDDNPVMRWMVQNCVAKVDANGNMRPDRKRSKEKIDGVVAMIMAFHLALMQGEKKEREQAAPGIAVL